MSEREAGARASAGARILRKVVVSFTLGAVAYAITELTNQQEIWSITLSVFIAGVTLVVQFLIEFEARLARVEATKERHSAKIERMVEESFAKINEATELFSLVDASPLHTEAVIQLIRRATLIEPTAAPLVSRFAQAEIIRVSEFLRGLSEGRSVMYEGEDRDWIITLTRHAEASIDATSLTTVDAGSSGFTNGGFWNTDLGQRYLEAQQEAVGRGVAIRRVFVILHPADPAADPGLAQVCQMHRDRGIEVRVLGQDTMPGTVRDTMFDFILFDGVISYEATPATRVVETAPPMILNTRLELQEERVKNRVHRFRQLWELAQEYPQPRRAFRRR